MNLPLTTGISLISKAFEKKQEDLLLQRWIANYQHLGFNEFKSQLGRGEESDQPVEEILGDVRKTLDLFRDKEVT